MKSWPETSPIARAGYDYAAQNFKAFPWKAPVGAKPLGIITGNQATAMGGAAAGVKFYAAYPMSPSTGVLMWMAPTRAATRHHGPASGRRDRCHEHGHRCGPCRLPGDVRDQRRRLCLDDRSRRHGGHDRNAGRLCRCATRRSGHRCADQDRARRPLAGARRRPGRLSAPRRGPDEPARSIPDDSGAVQPLRQIPVPRPGPGRPAHLRRNFEH